MLALAVSFIAVLLHFRPPLLLFYFPVNSCTRYSCKWQLFFNVMLVQLITWISKCYKQAPLSLAPSLSLACSSLAPSLAQNGHLQCGASAQQQSGFRRWVDGSCSLRRRVPEAHLLSVFGPEFPEHQYKAPSATPVTQRRWPGWYNYLSLFVAVGTQCPCVPELWGRADSGHRPRGLVPLVV